MAVAPTYATILPSGNVNHVPGDFKEALVTGTVGGSDTYVTNGFTVSPSSVGLQFITWAAPVTFSTGHWGIYIPSSGLLKVFSAAATELANGSGALQSATFTFWCYGK